jgi:sulfite reductase (ferredoxin)
VIDLVATLLLEAKDKLTYAQEAYEESKWSDAIYHAYAGFVNGASVIACRKPENKSPSGIIDLFDTVFVETKFNSATTLKQLVFQIRDNEPTPEFAQKIQTRSHCFFLKL